MCLKRDYRRNARADVHTRALLKIRVFWDEVSLELLFLEDERIMIHRNVGKHTQTHTVTQHHIAEHSQLRYRCSIALF